MPTVLDWNPTVDPSEFVPQLREALAAGLMVALPGDAGYVVLVNPVAANASERLAALSAATGALPPAILASDPDDASRLGLDVPIVARRLMLRAWPAPLTIAFPAVGAAAPTHWSEGVWEQIPADELVRFRCPDHPLTDAVLPGLPRDTLVVDTHLPTVAAVRAKLGEAVGVAVSAGELATNGRPTTICVNPDRWEIIQPGSFSAEEVQKLTARIILFVCTGNTCRSPLAEGLAKKLLSERLGCPPEELPTRGFWVLSAGVSTYGGGPVSPESVEVGAEFGADLRAHRSRPVNPQLLAAADDVVTMTQGHAHALATRYPGVNKAVQLLCGNDVDLDDPIGAGLDVYRDCARTILRHLERFIPEWIGP